jgi:hypothetical protein
LREILTVVQPCMLCEEPLEAWHVLRDDLTGEERIEKEPIPHDCEAMRRLLRERVRTMTW